MLHPITTALLAPILLWQGKRVRQVTPRLPEAEGPREGVAGTPEKPVLRVLILGDSAAAGVGVESQSQALVGNLVSKLSLHYQVHWTLLAKNGFTLANIIDLAKADTNPYDVVVVSAGVNDVTGRTRRHAFLSQLQSLCAMLRRQHRAQHILLTAVPPMHVFPALPQPLRWYLGTRAKRLNSVMQAYCRCQTQTQMLVVDFPFDTTYMASDGFHPSADGYRLWGGRAAAMIKERVKPTEL